jgi:hypothetical protein
VSVFSLNKVSKSECLQRIISSGYAYITPCSPPKVNRCIEGPYRLHRQGRRIIRARNQRESGWQATVPSRLFFDPEDGTLYSSQMSVDFRCTALRYIPEDSTPRNHGCENHNSSRVHLVFPASHYFTTKQSRLREACDTRDHAAHGHSLGS